jgi:hypothetical protein
MQQMNAYQRVIFLFLLVLVSHHSLAAGLDESHPYQAPATSRVEKTINREWTFNYFPDENADTAGCESPGFDDSSWPAIALPHTWQTYETTGKLHPFIYDASEKDDPYWWRGWGWYRKHFVVTDNAEVRKVFVEFDGVQKYCKVYVNGKLAGEHKGGYTSFYFDISGLVHRGSDNALVVAVNNRQNDPFKIPPMSAGNFDVYGGIYRDVRIILKGGMSALYIPFQGSAQHHTQIVAGEIADGVVHQRQILRVVRVDDRRVGYGRRIGFDVRPRNQQANRIESPIAQMGVFNIRGELVAPELRRVGRVYVRQSRAVLSAALIHAQQAHGMVRAVVQICARSVQPAVETISKDVRHPRTDVQTGQRHQDNKYGSPVHYRFIKWVG